jgi:hypothetical protein
MMMRIECPLERQVSWKFFCSVQCKGCNEYRNCYDEERLWNDPEVIKIFSLLIDYIKNRGKIYESNKRITQ